MEPFEGPWSSLGRPLGVLGWPLASFESPLGLLRVAGRSLEDRLVVVLGSLGCFLGVSGVLLVFLGSKYSQNGAKWIQ